MYVINNVNNKNIIVLSKYSLTIKNLVIFLKSLNINNVLYTKKKQINGENGVGLLTYKNTENIKSIKNISTIIFLDELDEPDNYHKYKLYNILETTIPIHIIYMTKIM
jgi:hypothetical protein